MTSCTDLAMQYIICLDLGQVKMLLMYLYMYEYVYISIH